MSADLDLAAEIRDVFGDDIDARARNHSDETVAPEQCAEWRDRIDDGELQKTIVAESGFSHRTVSAHVNGKCSHS